MPGMARVAVSREPYRLPSRGLRKPAVRQHANGREEVFRASAETGGSEAWAVCTGIGRQAVTETLQDRLRQLVGRRLHTWLVD